MYTSIEIEIKPGNNKNGKFININKENENIEIIKIIINYQIKSFTRLFEYCNCIEYICFKKFYEWYVL